MAPGSDRCILCEGPHLRVLEHVDGSDVNSVWRSALGMSGVLEVDSLSYIECRTCGLRFFSPQAIGGPELYEKLQCFEWYYLPEKPEFDIALEYLLHADSVLEIGAGTGSFAEHLGARRYRGLEQNATAAQVARDAGRDVLLETIEEHAARGGTYDAVVAFQVLEHVPSPNSFFLAAKACLAPNGRLIIAVPSDDGFVGEAVNDPMNAPPHHITRWRDRTLERVAALLDLQLVAIRHESVAGIHAPWARKVAIERRLRAILGIQYSVMDVRVRARVASWTAERLSRRTHAPPDVHGHTVVAVYARRADR